MARIRKEPNRYWSKEDKLKLINKSIEIILKNNLLNIDGIIVCEYENEEINCDLKILKEKKYGNKKNLKL